MAVKKLLLVGDPHVVVDELEECARLMGLAEEVSEEEMVNEVVLLGDLHHNHAITHVEVTSFWLEWLDRLSNGASVTALVGNHDRAAGDSAGAHALQPYHQLPRVLVVDQPEVDGPVAYVPYVASQADFLQTCNRPDLARAGLLLCHGTFDGGMFENGIYVPGGVAPELVPQAQVISGHLHTPQEFGKVWYVGAPRWRTLSDANTPRHLWVVGVAEDGKLAYRRPVPIPPEVCRPIRRTWVLDGVVVDGAAIDLEGPGPAGCRWHIDLKGPAVVNAAVADRISGLGYQIRRLDTDVRPAKLHESEGIEVSFWKHLKGAKVARGTSPEVLAKMARERLGLGVVGGSA